MRELTTAGERNRCRPVTVIISSGDTVTAGAARGMAARVRGTVQQSKQVVPTGCCSGWTLRALLGFQAFILNAHDRLTVGEVWRVDKPNDPFVALGFP